MVTDEPGPDILVHINVLRNFGRSSVSEGSVIELVAQQSQRGLQAIEILDIEPLEDSSDGAMDRPAWGDIGATDAELHPGRVKWFDRQRGFGFVNIFGSSEDIFVHMEVLRTSGYSDLQPGEALAVAIGDGPRGKLVTDVRPWDVGVEIASEDDADPAD